MRRRPNWWLPNNWRIRRDLRWLTCLLRQLSTTYNVLPVRRLIWKLVYVHNLWTMTKLTDIRNLINWQLLQRITKKLSLGPSLVHVQLSTTQCSVRGQAANEKSRIGTKRRKRKDNTDLRATVQRETGTESRDHAMQIAHISNWCLHYPANS